MCKSQTHERQGVVGQNGRQISDTGGACLWLVIMNRIQVCSECVVCGAGPLPVHPSLCIEG